MRICLGHTELEWSVLPGRQVQVRALRFRRVWLVKWGGDELFQPHLEKEGGVNKGDRDWCVCEEGEHF